MLFACCRTFAAVSMIALSLTVAASAADEWGSIEGQFILDGEIPDLPPLVAKGDASAKDAAVCAVEAVPDESIVVDADSKGIANICLYMRKAPKKIHPDLAKSEEPDVVFDQKGCRFLPHVLIVRTDQTVLVKSEDPINHNTRTAPFANKAENLIVKPNDRDGIPIAMPRSELKYPPVKVSCDIHPHMQGYWLVGDHPYVAVTDKDGKFKIENLPPGEHTFRVWHERSGYVNTAKFKRDLNVKVEAGKTTSVGPFKVKVADLMK